MTHIPPPPKRRCTAIRADGQPCRAWAMHPRPGHPAPLAPRCAAHRHHVPSPGAPDRDPLGAPDRDPLSAPDASPGAFDRDPLSAPDRDPLGAHDPSPAGLYDVRFSDEEYAAVQALTGPDSPESEIRAVRILLRRLLLDHHASQEMTGQEFERRALTFFKGAELVAHLLQIRRLLQKDADTLPPAIEAALDSLGEELGLAL